MTTSGAIRGLSLTQPWATLVAVGAKTIETRGWATRYRGALAIHAATRFPREARALLAEEPFVAALRDRGHDGVWHTPRPCRPAPSWRWAAWWTAGAPPRGCSRRPGAAG